MGREGANALPPGKKGGKEGMPSNWLYIDTNFPSFTQKESDGEKIETMQDYTYKRSIDIRITGIGTFSFDSSEVGGGTSTFVGTITGLSPGTTYEWICNMYYWGGSWIVSDYSDSGTATTYSGGGSGGSAKAVVNVGTYYNPNWKRYRAIVNIGTYYNTNWLSVRPVNNYGSYSQPNWR